MIGDDVRAVLFDVFGTVVDWRGSILAAGERLSQLYGLAVDWGAFADDWRRDGYLRPIGRIVTGQQAWADVDVLMRTHLDELVAAYGLSGLSGDDVAGLDRVWRRLDPWPDSVAGLTLLRQRFTVAPLSNGGFAQLTEMGKRAGLPWDCIISTSLFGAYKPDPKTYQGAVDLLELRPDQVMLVAAHPLDLHGARGVGLRTGYVPRPLEWGPNAPAPEPADPVFDVTAPDFIALAEALGIRASPPGR